MNTQAKEAAMPVSADVDQLASLGFAPGRYSVRPVEKMRRVIARRMVASVQTAPHFSITMPVEVDNALVARSRLNEKSDVRISLNDFVIKASSIALLRHPNVNSMMTDTAIVTHHHADVAFAVAFDGGLVTPVIRCADQLSVAEIAKESQRLAVLGRRKRLQPEEYTGGSFTVSNMGMFGITSFDAIINQPQSAILSVGAVEKRYVFDGDRPRIAQILMATLTSDHRLVDGATAAVWLNEFKRQLEDPSLWIESRP